MLLPGAEARREEPALRSPLLPTAPATSQRIFPELGQLEFSGKGK